MKKTWRWAFFTAVAAVALSLIAQNVVCTNSALAKDDKDAEKGKSDEDHGKSDEDHGNGGKEAPSAPELSGMLMILSAAGAVGGGYLLRRRLKKD